MPAAAIAHPFITAALIGSVGMATSQVMSTQSQAKAMKSAAGDAAARQDAAVKEMQTAQATASDQAKAQIDMRRRARTSTIFTSPLGISKIASTASKALLGQ